MKGDVKKKTSPRPDTECVSGHPAPDFLNVRARSASLFLRVVFSRNAAGRTARSSEFVPLPCGFISLSRRRQSVPVAQLHRWQRMVLSEARGLRLSSDVRGGIGLHRRLSARRHKEALHCYWILSLEPERLQGPRLATHQE